MFMVVIFLISLSRFLLIVVSLGPCVPNTEFIWNDKTCYCNNIGQWSESSCRVIDKQQQCNPGKIISQGCKQCICQENGKLECNEDECAAIGQDSNSIHSYRPEDEWCTPFKTYYINCNICVCPASGKMSEARCARDPSCTLFNQPDFTKQRKQIICIPRVMYIFPCLRCLCTNDGFLLANMCVETCNDHKILDLQKCVPGTYFRRKCNVCRCPDSGVADASICTKAICNETTALRQLSTIMSRNITCFPHAFIRPRCLYCDCTMSGTINNSSCIELECVSDFKYDDQKKSCKSGEIVPICTECLCLLNGNTLPEYCTKACSYESKLEVLDVIMKDIETNDGLLDTNSIKITKNEGCIPESIYIENDRVCICPKGNRAANICTSFGAKDNSNTSLQSSITIDYNAKCEPHTFIEFDCNTCFCNRSGQIDPKWCTFDDCEIKKIVQDTHKASSVVPHVEVAQNCNSGSIIKKDCNFCICPDNGLSSDLVCTKNDCPDSKQRLSDQFTCEPLVYYEVDCNVCFCPKDGLKNVAMCTKNPCEKSYLRSNDCVSGQLFSDECNVCVCPPNGNKAERACTNYTCMDLAPWKKIFQLSESLLGNQVPEDATRNLELCFPGEEFTVGCKLCVCPDMGLRIYAECSPILCDEPDDNNVEEQQLDSESKIIFPMKLIPTRNDKKRGESEKKGDETVIDHIQTINMTGLGRLSCKPGSIFIYRCKQCICPFPGDIDLFCRSLPPNEYCEQAFPKANFARRYSNFTDTDNSQQTKYRCYLPGKVMDVCFMCDCENNLILVREQCFKSDNESCEEALPTFLDDSDKLLDE